MNEFLSIIAVSLFLVAGIAALRNYAKGDRFGGPSVPYYR